MKKNIGFCKRDLPKRCLSHTVYIFCSNREMTPYLQSLSDIYLNGLWFIKICIYEPPLTHNKIDQFIKSPYRQYHKSFDKLCIVAKDEIPLRKRVNIDIEYVYTTSYLDQWLKDLKVS